MNHTEQNNYFMFCTVSANLAISSLKTLSTILSQLSFFLGSPKRAVSDEFLLLDLLEDPLQEKSLDEELLLKVLLPPALQNVSENFGNESLLFEEPILTNGEFVGR